ncbi:unnamed protein product, partial [Closterium sp. NIES-54]
MAPKFLPSYYATHFNMHGPTAPQRPSTTPRPRRPSTAPRPVALPRHRSRLGRLPVPSRKHVALCPVAPDAPARPVSSSPCALPVVGVVPPVALLVVSANASSERQRQRLPPAPVRSASACASANANACTQRQRQRRSLCLRHRLRHRQRQRRQQLMPPPPLPLPSRSFCRGRGGDVGVAGVTDQQPAPPFPLPLSTAALVAVWRGGGEERGIGGMRAVKGGRQRVVEEAATHLQLPPSAPVVLPLSPAVLQPLAAARSCSPGGLPPHAPTAAVPPPLPPHAPSFAASTLAARLLQLYLPLMH